MSGTSIIAQIFVPLSPPPPPPVPNEATVRSKAMVLLFLIHFLSLFPLYMGVLSLFFIFVKQYMLSFLVLQSS